MERAQCLADLAAHGVRLGEVEVIAGFPFRRQAAGINGLCELDRLPGVAELDRDGDGVDGDVGGAELAAEVVAVPAELSGDRGGGAEVLVGQGALVVAGRRYKIAMGR